MVMAVLSVRENSLGPILIWVLELSSELHDGVMLIFMGYAGTKL